MIPKTIYTYWNKTPSLLVQKCIQTFNKFDPDITVTVLDENQTYVQEKPIGFDSLSPQHQSDWLRLSLISERGGIWLDSTIIVLKSHRHWIDMNSNKVHGFKVPFDCNIMENWAFAAPPAHPLIVSWREEFRQCIEVGFNCYIKRYRQHLKCLSGHLPYLSCHAALVVTLFKNKYLRKNVVLRRSIGPRGPLGYFRWPVISYFLFMMSRKCEQASPFLKLRGKERKTLSMIIKYKLYTSNSTVGMLVSTSEGKLWFLIGMVLLLWCMIKY